MVKNCQNNSAYWEIFTKSTQNCVQFLCGILKKKRKLKSSRESLRQKNQSMVMTRCTSNKRTDTQTEFTIPPHSALCYLEPTGTWKQTEPHTHTHTQLPQTDQQKEINSHTKKKYIYDPYIVDKTVRTQSPAPITNTAHNHHTQMEREIEKESDRDSALCSIQLKNR